MPSPAEQDRIKFSCLSHSKSPAHGLALFDVLCSLAVVWSCILSSTPMVAWISHRVTLRRGSQTMSQKSLKSRPANDAQTQQNLGNLNNRNQQNELRTVSHASLFQHLTFSR
jgi:hypothetical protein